MTDFGVSLHCKDMGRLPEGGAARIIKDRSEAMLIYRMISLNSIRQFDPRVMRARGTGRMCLCGTGSGKEND